MSSSPASSSAAKHRQTNPEDRLSLREKAGYSAGGMSYTLLGNSIGNMANVVLNIGLGMNPFLVGLLLAIPRFIDALLDPLIGAGGVPSVLKRLDAGHEPEGVLRPLFQLQTKLRVVLAREHEGFSDRFEASLRRFSEARVRHLCKVVDGSKECDLADAGGGRRLIQGDSIGAGRRGAMRRRAAA